MNMTSSTNRTFSYTPARTIAQWSAQYPIRTHTARPNIHPPHARNKNTGGRRTHIHHSCNRYVTVGWGHKPVLQSLYVPIVARRGDDLLLLQSHTVITFVGRADFRTKATKFDLFYISAGSEPRRQEKKSSYPLVSNCLSLVGGAPTPPTGAKLNRNAQYCS